MILHIIGLILVGLVVGALGRLFHPGSDPIGLVMTTVIRLVEPRRTSRLRRVLHT